MIEGLENHNADDIRVDKNPTDRSITATTTSIDKRS